MLDEDSRELIKENQTLRAKLAVRNCQYNIAVEGLNTIVESNDPIGVGSKTLSAMEDCIP